MIQSLIVGIISTVLGIALSYWISRRRFYRRNVAGLQTFSSFERSWIITGIERFGKILALLLILFGLLLIWSYSENRKSLMAKKEQSKTEKKQ